MIHTFDLFIVLDYLEVQDLQRRFQIKYTDVNTYFRDDYPGVTMSISMCRDGKWRLYLVVDTILMLGKADITDDDYVAVEDELRFILSSMFGHSSHFKNHVLQRIDYRYDVVIENEKERLLLLELYKKLTKSDGFQKKCTGKVVEDIFTPYKTTIYHASNSIESVVYLKEEERNANDKHVEDYEKDVVRYEVRLKRDHLYYMEAKKKNGRRPRKLEEYFKIKVCKDYFDKYMLQIYHAGDFFKIDEVRLKLKKTTLSQSNKSKIDEFLILVSSHSIDTPLKCMSPATFKRRLAVLKEMGVNPIMIPKNHTNAPNMIKNPLNDFPS